MGPPPGKRSPTSFRLEPEALAVLEAVRTRHFLPSLNAALNYVIGDYKRRHIDITSPPERHQSEHK